MQNFFVASILYFCFALGEPLAQAEGFLNPHSVKKIYYLLASAKSMGRSLFGHAYLRVSTEDTPNPNDLVVEFVADSQVTSFIDYLRALGIGNSLQRAVHVEKYSALVQEMNFVSLRDLSNYELRLTEEQKIKIINILNQAIQAGSYGEYSFFFENCASATHEIITIAGVPIEGGISGLIPNAIPSLLEESHLVGKVYEDLNLNSRRVQLLEKYEPQLKLIIPDFAMVKEFLLSSEIEKRILGFDLILSKTQNINFSEATSQISHSPKNISFDISNPIISKNVMPKPVSDYLNAFQLLEPRISRPELREALQQSVNQRSGNEQSINDHSKVSASKNTLQSFVLTSTRLNFDRDDAYDGRISLALTGQKISVDASNQYFLNYTFAIGTTNKAGSKTIFTSKIVQIPLSFLHTNLRGEFLWKDVVVGLKTSAKLFETDFILPGITFIPHILKTNNMNWLINTYVLVDISPSVYRVIESTKSPLLIPFKNDDPTRPSCYGMVDFQKALLERVIFDVQGKHLSESEYLELIQNILAGKLTVIPGYADPQSWLASLNSSKVRDVIYNYHIEHYATMSGAVSNWWDSIKVKTEDLLEMGRMARLGYYSSVYQRVEGVFGHAILILDTIDEGDRIRIEAYDPNLGFIKDLFYFDKKTEKIHSALYSTESLYARSFDLSADVLNKSLLSSQPANLIVLLSRISGIYSITPEMLSQIY